MTTVPRLSGITLPGAGYPKLINFAAPELPQGAANLVGLYTLGGPVGFTTFNFANPDLPLLAAGAPVLSEIGAALNRINYFDTQLPSTADMTIMAVAKPILSTVNAENQFIASNFNSGSPSSGDVLGFFPLNVSGTVVPSVRASIGTSAGVTATGLDLTGADATKWNAFAGRYRATGQAQIFRSVEGNVTNGVESAAATRSVSPRTITIGREYSGATTGTINEAMVAIFNSALSDAQIVANFAYLRSTWGPALGINTL